MGWDTLHIIGFLAALAVITGLIISIWGMEE